MLNFATVRSVLVIIFISIIFNIVFAGQQVNYKSPESLLHRTLLLDAANREGTRILVGERGLIFVSRDNSPWKIIQLPANVTLTAVFLQNRNLGWIVGHDAVIYRTNNGGESWQQVYAAPEEESPLLDVWFHDEKNGIAIGAYGLYLKTTDGGITWIREKFTVTRLNDTDTARNNSDDLAEYYDLHLNAVARSGNDNMYIVAEAGRIYCSENMGMNWLELPSPYIGSLFGVLSFQDTILVFGLRGHLFRSEDGGKTWDKIETQTHETLTGGVLLHDKTIVIVGMGGTVLYSNNQGRSFSSGKTAHRDGYSNVIEKNNNELILVGDHGIDSFTRQDLGIVNE